jgi:membrane protein DedA with SNARE-associated domain
MLNMSGDMMMDDQDLYQYLLNFADSEFVLAIVVLLTTFILEDMATSVASLLSVNGYIDPVLAVISLMCGIVLGDLSLYWFGRLARRWAWAKALLAKKGLKKARGFIGQRVVLAVLLARFVPGMRLPTYSAMGLLSADFRVFALTVVFAVGVWTVTLFTLIYSAGQAFIDSFHMYRWYGFVLLFLVGVFGPALLGWVGRWLMSRRTKIL